MNKTESIINLFYFTSRYTNKNTIYYLINKLYNSTHDTVLILSITLYFRDYKNGRGEKQLSYFMLLWLKGKMPDIYEKFLPVYVRYGYWKDIFNICKLSIDNSKKINVELEMIIKQLQIDINLDDNISLLCKWIPSEKSSFNKYPYYLANKLSRLLYPNDRKAKQKYRKTISNLRSKLFIVERKMCNQEWNAIDYSNVPSTAFSKYEEAFYKRDVERFGEYRKTISRESSIIDKFSIMRSLLMGNKTVELEDWSSDVFENSVVFVDGLDNDVVSRLVYGLTISQSSNSIFKNKIILYNDNYRIEEINSEIVDIIKNANLTSNIDLVELYHTILIFALENNIDQDVMPSRLYILTDKLFTYDNLVIKQIRDMYAINGYHPPYFVFWSRTNTPYNRNNEIVNYLEDGVIISGITHDLDKFLLKNDVNHIYSDKAINDITNILMPYLENINK